MTDAEGKIALITGGAPASAPRRADRWHRRGGRVAVGWSTSGEAASSLANSLPGPIACTRSWRLPEVHFAD